MGEQFTAADVVIGSGLRWGMMFKLMPERPEFVAYAAALGNGRRCSARRRPTRNSPRREMRDFDRAQGFVAFERFLPGLETAA